MKVLNGIIKKVTKLDDGNEYGQVSIVHKGATVNRYTHYSVRKLVTSKQEETEVYLKFSKDMEEKRSKGLLINYKGDDDCQPKFTFLYPKNNSDGSYVIQLSWWEKDS